MGEQFDVHGAWAVANETTVADALGAAGYAPRAAVGKWHLGQRPDYLPHNRGFDHYLGVPYSVDQGSLKDHNCKQNGTTIASKWGSQAK